MQAAANRNFGPMGPYAIVALMLATILGFYGNMFLPVGILGTISGAIVGLLWALFTGVIANRTLSERKELRANAPLFFAIVVIGLMTGPSLMYGWMMTAALNEPSTTSAVLSALMWPAVPFYITLNSAMELLLVSLLLFWNWNVDPRRRLLILVGVSVYFVMRVWTYLVFAEARLDMAQHALSQADVEWFKQTLANRLSSGAERHHLYLPRLGCLGSSLADVRPVVEPNARQTGRIAVMTAARESPGFVHQSLADHFRKNDSKLVRAGFVNGLPGFITREADGELQATALEIQDGKVAAIYVVRNPDKLRHLH